MRLIFAPFRTDCARSGSGGGDFVQYLAQGNPRGSSAAWKKKDLSNDAIASTKSERSRADIQAPLGRATTRSLERVAASVGLLNGAPIEFELVKDVPDGGVLFALPALLLLGLLSKSREMFSMLEGFYPLESIFLLLALMALARIPSLEALRYVAPGEWGRVCRPEYGNIEYDQEGNHRSLQGLSRHAKYGPFCACP